jgi:hypothetical protein
MVSARPPKPEPQMMPISGWWEVLPLMCSASSTRSSYVNGFSLKNNQKVGVSHCLHLDFPVCNRASVKGCETPSCTCPLYQLDDQLPHTGKEILGCYSTWKSTRPGVHLYCILAVTSLLLHVLSILADQAYW